MPVQLETLDPVGWISWENKKKMHFDKDDQANTISHSTVCVLVFTGCHGL